MKKDGRKGMRKEGRREGRKKERKKGPKMRTYIYLDAASAKVISAHCYFVYLQY